MYPYINMYGDFFVFITEKFEDPIFTIKFAIIISLKTYQYKYMCCLYFLTRILLCWYSQKELSIKNS